VTQLARPAAGWKWQSKPAGRPVGKSAGHQPEGCKDAASSDKADRPMPCCPEKPLSVDGAGSVPQTDTGGQGEKPKVRERNHVKELGKLTP